MRLPAPLSYGHGTSGVPLLGETIGANLERVAARFGDRDALIDVAGGQRLTYREFNAAVNTIALGLLDLGVDKGDRVGIWAPNCMEWTVVQYASAKIGAILVTINPAYRSAELAYVLQQAGVRLLISVTELKGTSLVDMIAELRPSLAALEGVIFLGSAQWDTLQERGDSTPTHRLHDAAAGLSFDDPINIQYTSGTTGFPKGATLSHHNILNNGYFVGELCGYTEQDRVCVPVPLYHCFGMVMGNLGATTHGAALVYPAPSFDPKATLDAAVAERCTSLYGVPTMFIAELGLPEFGTYDFSSLRTGIMAGSPCPVEVMKRVVADMGMSEVTICYGMTETSPVSTQTRADDDLERRVTSVGRPGPHIEVKVVDPETGLTVPRGARGEFCTRGYSVMLGYWNDPEQTAGVVDGAGWMHTGDLATMDVEGYCSIVGRSKDMVIRGGENIYPREVEEFLYSHPAIADVQVVGVPDARYGEELCAWVKVRLGSQVTEEQVRDFCRDSLAHYKVPRYVLFVEDFPMTVTGKIQKYLMRDESVRSLGLQAVATTVTA